MDNTEISTPVWELKTLEAACQEYISENFAVWNGVLDLAFEYNNTWKSDPVRYATPIAKFDTVRNWMRNDVWSLYANYKFNGIEPDFSTIPTRPHGYFEIINDATNA